MLQSARSKLVHTVNQTLITTYFEIGRLTVEEQQKGKDRAEYGKSLLQDLSKTLTREFGTGFSITNIQQMRRFYLIYQKQQTAYVKSEKQFSRQHLLNLTKLVTLLKIDAN